MNDVWLILKEMRMGRAYLYCLKECDLITPSITTAYAHTANGQHSTFQERLRRLIEKTLRP